MAYEGSHLLQQGAVGARGRRHLPRGCYVIVQRNAMKVWEDIQNAIDGPTYRERLEADDEAMALLSQEKLDEIFDPWTSSPARTLCSIACRSWSSSSSHLLPGKGRAKVAPYGSTWEVTLRSRDLPSLRSRL